ncbi:hypothetical protein, partial [Methylocucumis oryzae]
AAEVRAKLADLEPDSVPSLQAVKLSLELAAEEDLKHDKERKGKGEASAAYTMHETQGKRHRQQGGFKQQLRDELTRQKEALHPVYTQADAIRDEREKNQAARERQEQARTEQPRPSQAWHEANREQADQQSRERQQRQQTAQEVQLARILRRRQRAGRENENDGGREFEP